MNKNQNQIALELKLVAIFIALLGLIFFGGFTAYAYIYRPDYNLPLAEYIRSNIVYIWLTAFICYTILFFFWRIVNEIGKDNSFSIENEKNFKYMSYCCLLVIVENVIRLAIWTVKGNVDLIAVSYTVLKMIVFAVITVFCIALSKLVRNAYEIKLENELTI